MRIKALKIRLTAEIIFSLMRFDSNNLIIPFHACCQVYEHGAKLLFIFWPIAERMLLLSYM